MKTILKEFKTSSVELEEKPSQIYRSGLALWLSGTALPSMGETLGSILSTNIKRNKSIVST